MNDEARQKLKALAESLGGAEWEAGYLQVAEKGSGRLIIPVCPVGADYIAAAAPKAVLELLEEINLWHRACLVLASYLGNACDFISELEVCPLCPLPCSTEGWTSLTKVKALKLIEQQKRMEGAKRKEDAFLVER